VNNRSKLSISEKSRRGNDLSKLSNHLENLGIDSSSLRSRSKSRHRDTSSSNMEVDRSRKRNRSVSRSISRSRSKTPAELGFKDEKSQQRALYISRQKQKQRNFDARQGESDRHISVAKPKHLFSGKRSNGKTSRR